MLSVVSPGTSFVIETYFREPDGSAFVATNPPTYTLRTPDQQLVLSGAAQQDPQVPSRWFATVTLPQTTPIFELDKKYSLTWLASNKVNKRSTVEFFNVAPVTDYCFIENDKVVLEGAVFKDGICLPRHLVPDDLIVSIKDENSNCYMKGRVSTAPVRTYFDKNFYSFSFPTGIATYQPAYDPTVSGSSTGCGMVTTNPNNMMMKAGANCTRPYIVQWEYSVNGETFYEFHFVYMISHKMLIAMNDLRRMIDKARNDDIIHQLQFTDIDLVHYIMKAMERINGAPPVFTNYMFAGLPMQFNTCVTYAAAWEALNAQMLAEGVSNFEFSGQAVSLSVDRVSAYEAMFSRMDSWLNENLSKIKSLTIKSGNVGVLGISLGVTNNIALNGQAAMNRLRQLYMDSGGYSNMGLNTLNP